MEDMNKDLKRIADSLEVIAAFCKRVDNACVAFNNGWGIIPVDVHGADSGMSTWELEDVLSHFFRKVK